VRPVYVLQEDEVLVQAQNDFNNQLTEQLRNIMQASLLERGEWEAAEEHDISILLTTYSKATCDLSAMLNGLGTCDTSTVKGIVRGVRNFASHGDTAPGVKVTNSSQATVTGAAPREGVRPQLHATREQTLS
jgi:hypothetical protein